MSAFPSPYQPLRRLLFEKDHFPPRQLAVIPNLIFFQLVLFFFRSSKSTAGSLVACPLSPVFLKEIPLPGSSPPLLSFWLKTPFFLNLWVFGFCLLGMDSPPSPGVDFYPRSHGVFFPLVIFFFSPPRASPKASSVVFSCNPANLYFLWTFLCPDRSWAFFPTYSHHGLVEPSFIRLSRYVTFFAVRTLQHCRLVP